MAMNGVCNFPARLAHRRKTGVGLSAAMAVRATAIENAAAARSGLAGLGRAGRTLPRPAGPSMPTHACCRRRPCLRLVE